MNYRMHAPDVSRFEGCLLGLMVGDSLGLPREGLSPARAERLFGRELRHRFVFGCGMDAKGFWRNLPEVRAMREG